MLVIKSILVANDFSPFCQDAVAHAVAMAKMTGAKLHMLFARVIHEDIQPALALLDSASAQPQNNTVEKERLLAALEKQLVSCAVETASLDIVYDVVRDVAAAPAILRYASEHKVDLIVVGTHGRRGIRRLLLGSVAEEVVRIGTLPILTVRDDRDPGTKHLNVRKVLVPVDFSKHSRSAVVYAKHLAAMQGASVDMLHVVEDTLHAAFYNMGVFSIYDVQPDIEARALEHLQQYYEEADGPAGDVRYHAIPGHAAKEIVQFAADHDIDLIVTATHGMTALEHFTLGSVAEKIVRRAGCPVFTVRAFGKSLLSSKAI